MIDTEKYVKIISSQTEKPKTAESVGVEINNQDITITENGVYTASAGYTGIGIATVNVPQSQPVIQSLSITPTTSEQTITATGGVNGYSPITVSAVTSSIDSNITADNIKSGVSILGVEGRLTPAPDYYIEISKNANGVAQQSSYLMNFNNLLDVGDYVFTYKYWKNNNISGIVNLSSLTKVSGSSGFYYTFSESDNITGVNLSSVTEISGNSACTGMFNDCSNFTSFDLSSLTIISGYTACQGMFANTIITSANLSSLTTIKGNNGCRNMFMNCTSLTSVNLSSLTDIGSGGSACQQMFNGCTSLTRLDFPALTSTSFGSFKNQLHNMLQNVTGCVVHFPSNLQSAIGSWADVTAGFGGTNTTVLFDLPATE